VPGSLSTISAEYSGDYRVYGTNLANSIFRGLLAYPSCAVTTSPAAQLQQQQSIPGFTPNVPGSIAPNQFMNSAPSQQQPIDQSRWQAFMAWLSSNGVNQGSLGGAQQQNNQQRPLDSWSNPFSSAWWYYRL
jgi:hypothetical protein